MSRGPAKFTQREVTRALKGAMAAGMVPTAARISRTGEIVLTFGNEPAEDGDEWDKALGLDYDGRSRPARQR